MKMTPSTSPSEPPGALGTRLTNGAMYFVVRTYVLPSASGLIFAGMRLGAAQGFTGVILAELLITPTGVGDLITYYRSVADYPKMFASILSIIVVASVTITLLQKIEETVFRPELRQA